MKLNWRAVLGIALSGAFFWWVLRDVSPSEVWANARAADPVLLLISVTCATLVFPIRARRWRTILSPIENNIPFGPLWRSTAIGMMVNNVVPARVGEIARAYALTRERPSIAFSASFASLAVDRVFDAVIVMLLLLFALLDPAFPSEKTAIGQKVANTLGIGTLFAGALLALLYLLVFLPERIISLYEWFARRLAPKLEARGRDALLAFAAGLGVLRSPRRFAEVFWWALVHWLVMAFSFWTGFKAFGIDVSYQAALLVQGVIVVGVAIPQAPGFFGVFEAAAKWTLVGVYGVDTGRAVSWAITYHFLTFIPITAIGGYYFVRLGMHFRDLTAQTDTPAATAALGPSSGT